MFDSQKAGRQIALFRKNRSITQEELARMLNVSPQAVSKWENGHTMPEVSVLPELSRILNATIDEILLPTSSAPANADFEHILLPYDGIAGFSGSRWPRSMAQPAILSAIKLFMGLESRRDSFARQMNDDTEYILQSAFTSTCFGYSWGRDFFDENCLAIYGLSCEICDSSRQDGETLSRLAAENILKGYPVVVEPKKYEDILLASGFSNHGTVLKGISFLDGDDEKNSIMSFDKLQNFPDWHKKEIKLILIRPAKEKADLEEVCKKALLEGYRLLCNKTHEFDQPLVGYGLVIYKNWREELAKEAENSLEIACLYPHIFIQYENKMRVKQFLELCTHIVSGIAPEALAKAAAKYAEITEMWETAMKSWLTENPKDTAAAKETRKGFDYLLRRSSESEAEALAYWASAICTESAE